MISEAELSSKLAAKDAEIDRLSARNKELTAQIEWFQKQLFGQKSERRVFDVPKEQLFLGEQFDKQTDTEPETQTIGEHQRKKREAKSTDGDNEDLFFDETYIPLFSELISHNL